MKKVLCSKDLTLHLKLRLAKCYVHSVLYYGVEAWTLNADAMRRLNSFEMWTYRRILRVSWKDRITNIEVLRRIGREKEVERTIKERKLQYLGHIMRGEKWNEGLSDQDNLIRLDRALKGKARETVKALLISPSNVSRIINMLEMNFGRPEWIVLSLMEKVKKISPVKEDSLESCIFFSNAVTNMVVTMRNVNSSLYLFNPEMLVNIVEKLPTIQKYNWGKYKYQKDLQGIPTSLEDFANWYEEEVNSMASTSNPFQRSKHMSRKETVSFSKKSEPRKAENSKVCVFCQRTNHKIEECGEFIEKTIPERRQSVMNLRLCFLCLQLGHMANKCFLRTRCGIMGCKGKHSSLLHLARDPNSSYPTLQDKTAASSEFCAKLNDVDQKTLLRIAPVILRGPYNEIKTFALFDEGSTCSMMDENLAMKLNLSGPIVPLRFQWTNNITHFEDESKMVDVDISADSNKQIFYNLKNLRTVKNLSIPNQKINVDLLSQNIPHLNRKILEAVENATPEILIGQDNCGLIISRQVIQPKMNQPIMSKSKLGWTIHGALNDSTDGNEMNHATLCCRHIEDDELHRMVKDSFKLEAFGVNEKIISSVEDRKALEIMNSTAKRIGNRWEIGHLWRNMDVAFPDSKVNALNRLSCMERKMKKDCEFAKQYREKIQDYINKGYARKLELEEITENPRNWFLPHFAVWNVHKPGKIRLVFDAAARSFGYSLNDFLLQGPDFVPSLVSVLWRFRQGKIAFSGDIREMFHQVLIKKEDRCAQRFLWHDENNLGGIPDVYEMNVMIFGAVSSPSVAQFIKNRNAECFEDKFPGISRAMKRQHYVDDYLDSCSTYEEAIQRVRDVIYVHNQAGFEMVKWISNSKRVLESIPKCLRAESEKNIKIDSQEIKRVLGLSWSPETDQFIYSLNFHKIPIEKTSGSIAPTKRKVLRIIMSIFDPFGFLATLIIKANVFCDARDKAYSYVAYFRTEEKEDNTETHVCFVTAEYKVAPLTQQIIPKLELQGAVLACRLSKKIWEEVEHKIRETHYWTDSLVVLKQIRSQSRRFPMFVSCRIGEIHENADVFQWHWDPSEENVADQATKELKNIDLKQDGDWFSGPSFLGKPRKLWYCEGGKNSNEERHL
ncbi:uncharacterized protein LOC123673410 [Harmonia axyridis]|uniref:uncharacterized protein LOC123673410 n=1 Tax=Harmonia axyridis TaxID=115357 RepID=UPI001E276AE6|nr:uncharacterized protein LOC123673410 [Harmonia axyridis]